MGTPIWMVNTQWRDSGRMVLVGPFDGRLTIFLVLLLLFPGLKMLGLSLFAMLFFYILQYMGYTLPNAYRKILIVISGKTKNGVHYWRQRRFNY
jgi:hypothetical protein